MAGPFEQQDFERLVPWDKKLAPDWVASLFARGEPTVYRGADLDRIGMPIGGACAGQLYLGGDGRLWHWDIFNQPISTNASHYAQPMPAASPVEQGFAIRVGELSLPLDRTGFADVSFRGQYPIATVEYRDRRLPLTVTLEAFSPFIPLETGDSSLPAAVMQFTLHNVSATPVDATITGKLENAVCLQHRDALGVRRNRLVSGDGFAFLESSARGADLQRLPGYGTMGLAALTTGNASEPRDQAGALPLRASGTGEAPLKERLVGELARAVRIEAASSTTVTFVVTWHFPNLEIKGLPDRGREYATRFESALAVAAYVSRELERLASGTRLWRDTWYDSTLPHWFLDRTFLNASILATSTCYRLASGRFWAWEGVGCCEGTCGHVWQYAHAMARLFPELERTTRERVDFGLALQPDGAIHFRGEHNAIPAIDAQAGTILRVLREHQMSADAAFLGRVWPRVKRATEWLIRKDADADGIIESNQHNTLDTDWFGPVAWLSGLYLAALVAAAAMADEMRDPPFAARCRDIAARGRSNLVSRLFDGEYFVNRPDPAHKDAINSGTGCEIDQVMGQGWAWQINLPRVLPTRETLSTLRSLWRYNFTPDVGPYRQRYKPGRWYAMPGEAGLLMCTFPRAGWDYEQASGKGPDWAAGYFNECMNGFEYQAAGHMIWEGLVQEGLAVTRAVHDRYHASRRNPWNEIECGDHYARSMASYGVYLAACGFEYHGPKGRIGFAPRMSADDFRAAFTAAEGWGTFAQKREGRRLTASLEVKHGSLRMKTVVLALERPPRRVEVRIAGKRVSTSHVYREGRLEVELAADARIAAGQRLELEAD